MLFGYERHYEWVHYKVANLRSVSHYVSYGVTIFVSLFTIIFITAQFAFQNEGSQPYPS